MRRIVLCLCFFVIARGSPVSPPKQSGKGLLDALFYDDASLTDVAEGANSDYDVVYDTRQKGDENYRIHINGVYVAMPTDSQSAGISSDLLEAIDQVYSGSLSSGTTEEVHFTLGPTTEATPLKPLEGEEKPAEKPTVVIVEEKPEDNTIPPKPEAVNRNSDIIVLQKERPSSRRRVNLADIIKSLFSKRDH